MAIALVVGFGAGSALTDGLGLGSLGGVALGGSSGANVITDVAGVDVKADVPGNHHVATACVGSFASRISGNVSSGGGICVTVGGVGTLEAGGGGSTGTGGTGTGGIGKGGLVIGTGGVIVPTPTQLNTSPKVARCIALRCKPDGSTVVYVGFSVVDRHGVFVGWMYYDGIDIGLKLTEVRRLTANNHCVFVAGGSCKINGATMTTAKMDRTHPCVTPWPGLPCVDQRPRLRRRRSALEPRIPQYTGARADLSTAIAADCPCGEMTGCAAPRTR